MIKSINNINLDNKYSFKSNSNKTPSFGNANLSKEAKYLNKFIKSQENLSTTRFIQGTMTNWLPKAILSRSLVDFSEFTFLEFLESGLFYFAAPFLGEKMFRNGLFKNVQPKNLKNNVSSNLAKSLDEIKKSSLDKNLQKRLVSTKAGVVLACLAVPALEYGLGFAKNLFTLKVFKISDFNNVANLNKEKNEDAELSKKVETHSKKVLTQVGILSGLGVASGLLLASKGHKSNITQKFSEILLEPGVAISKLLHKAGVNSKSTDNFLKDYLKLDFSNNNGKLALSKGQLALTCITGLFGYSSAAKDRGKLDFYEVWTRVPLVVVYTIFGSSILDSGFKKILAKKGKFPELIKSDSQGNIAPIPTSKDLPVIAEKLSKANKTPLNSELETLIKQKSIITGVPYLFSVVAMGFLLSGVSRLWTQYRYNQQTKNAQNPQKPQADFIKTSPVFKGIIEG